jgi:hypothetical protein
MLALTDDELNLIRQAAEPLDHRQRGQYLRQIAEELARYPAIGPAVVMGQTGSVPFLKRPCGRRSRAGEGGNDIPSAGGLISKTGTAAVRVFRAARASSVTSAVAPRVRSSQSRAARRSPRRSA